MKPTSNVNAEAIVKQICESKALLEDTQKKMKEPGRFIDLTCKMSLRDNCIAVKQRLKKRPDKMTEKDLEELRLATERLRTIADNVFKIYPNE